MSTKDALILIAVFGGYVTMYYYGKFRGYKEGYGVGYKIGFLGGAVRLAIDNAWEQVRFERAQGRRTHEC